VRLTGAVALALMLVCSCSSQGSASDAGDGYDACGAPFTPTTCAQSGGRCTITGGLECPNGAQQVGTPGYLCDPPCQEGPPILCCAMAPDAGHDGGSSDAGTCGQCPGAGFPNYGEPCCPDGLMCNGEGPPGCIEVYECQAGVLVAAGYSGALCDSGSTAGHEAGADAAADASSDSATDTGSEL
jgi:hypothetical protein